MTYARSLLSFLIPLLKGEVNISDLILFEGIKIFYPKHYEFIKSSPEYFIQSYNERFSYGKDNKKVDEFKTKTDQLGEDLTKNERHAVIDLMEHLFPIVKEALGNYSYVNTNWTKEKRIASSKYFDRYFIYSVPKNDISDICFEDYIKGLNTKDIKEVLVETNEMLTNVDPIEYLNKVGIYEDTLDWKSKQTIIKVICANQEKFEGMKGGNFMFSFHNPKFQAAITISRILQKHNNYDERFDFSKFLMTEEVPFEFSREIIRWLSVGKTEEEKVIKTIDLITLDNILLERALKDSSTNNTNIFEKYEHFTFSLLGIWYEKNPRELKEYIDEHIESKPRFVETIIYSLTTIYSSTNPNPYKIDFEKESYELLKKYSDIEKFKSFITKENYPDLEKEEVKFFNRDDGQTKMNAMRQFLYWYELDHQSKEASEPNRTEE